MAGGGGRKKAAQKCPFRCFSGWQKMGKNGVGRTVGWTTGWTIRASIDPFKGKNRGKKREKRAETYPLIPFNAGEKAP